MPSMRDHMALALLVLVAGAIVGLGGCRDGRAYPFRPLELDAGGVDATTLPDAGAPDYPPPVCPTSLVGYAVLDGSTNGGGDAASATATTFDQLKALAAQTAPGTIRISGTIALSAPLEIESDKTVVGAHPGDGLVGDGLMIKGKRNVIVRNLTISKALAPDDAITIQGSNHVWIDHCDLSSDLDEPKGTYDGLVDITHASDNVTVSWNWFHDHYDTSLVGHSESNAAEDTGHLTVTYHHNRFTNTPSGSPRVRFGHVHVFNNHYENVSSYGIASTTDGTMFVERNVFDNVVLPITTTWQDKLEGTVHDVANLYEPTSTAAANIIDGSNTWLPPYAYMGDSTDSLRFLVQSCSGVGKVP